MDIEISLFEIPDFLKNSELGIYLLAGANKYKIGSEEWINEMRSLQVVKYFAEDDSVNSFEDFVNLIYVCHFWGLPICASIFVYYLKSSEEFIIKIGIFLVNKFLSYYDHSITTILNTEIIITDSEEFLNVLIKYTNVESIRNENEFYEKVVDFLINDETNLNYSINEVRFYVELIKRLISFYYVFRNKKDIIEYVPVIPFNKNNEIMGENYNKKFKFELRNMHLPRDHSDIATITAVFDFYIEEFPISKFVIKKIYDIVALKNSVNLKFDFSYKLNWLGEKINGNTGTGGYELYYVLGNTALFLNKENTSELIGCLNDTIKNYSELTNNRVDLFSLEIILNENGKVIDPYHYERFDE